MSSVNNIFLVNAESPVKRYVKTVPSKVGGIRFSSNGENQVGFVLESEPTGFVYDAEVLEIYTEREDRALRQLNKSLFTNGYLKEYALDAPPVDVSNMLTDDEIVEIASLRNIYTLEARINELTSPFTLRRILDEANNIGRPAKTVATIQKRLDAVSK